MDQYLKDAANAMIAAARSGRSVRAVLKKRCPHIHRQIVADGQQRELLALWGRSSNRDENVGGVIVPPAVLQDIGELAGVPMRGRFVHAGLAHTYGYLFSLIDTPYGPKRRRWVTTDLETGFGLETSLLGDRPSAGTLLGNLTWFLASIVCRGLSCRLLTKPPPSTVADAFIQFEYARLQPCRIVERFVISGGRPVIAYTDLVPFLNPSSDPSGENTLLIYSLQNGDRPAPRLVTAFPIRTQAVKDLTTAVQPRRKVRLRLRYNAYVPGLFGREIWGYRRLARPLG